MLEHDESDHKRILVVDDNGDMRLLQRVILESGGFEVFTAESGEDALSFLSRDALLDLILLDVSMEDMSGPEFLKILEKKSPNLVRDVPVVFMTGMDTIELGKSAGVIRKPIADVGKYLSTIHRFIDQGAHSVRPLH